MKRIAAFSSAALLILAFYQNCAPGFNVNLDESFSLDLASEGVLENAICQVGESAAPFISDTCLGEVLMAGKISANIIEYAPQYPLFSDSATKRRWIYLPANSKIDNANPDEWIFPIGTILWKEFSIGQNKIETRQTEKISADNRRFSVYLWSRDQKTAQRVETLPTTEDFAYFDVKDKYAAPPLNQCITCHAGSTDKVLGFSYLQLSHENSTQFGLDRLKLDQWLTQSPSDIDRIQSRVGDNGLQARALGYLQANCSSCHNSKNSYLPNFRHAFGSATADDETALQSLRAKSLVNRSDPASSIILSRLNSASSPMPPRFSHLTVDQNGVALIQEWINSLAASTPTPAPIPMPTPMPMPAITN
jgi:hypothetical protein